MKTFLSLLLIISSFSYLSGQTENNTPSNPVDYTHSIGLSVNSLGYLEGEYNYHFTNKFKMHGSFGVNYDRAIVMRVAGTYTFFNWDFVSIESGLGLSYWNNENINYPEELNGFNRIPNIWKVELPIWFNFPLSEKFTAQLGFTFLNDMTGSSYNSGLHASIKLGTLYRF